MILVHEIFPPGAMDTFATFARALHKNFLLLRYCPAVVISLYNEYVCVPVVVRKSMYNSIRNGRHC